MNHLIARFQNEPSLVAPGTENRFEALLAAAAVHPMLVEVETAERMGEDFWTELGDRASRILRPYVVDNGILQVPVRGVLLNGFPYAFYDLATGYEYISEAVRRGIDDSNVKGIALVIDSPGGMVAGCFDLVDEIFAARSAKPIHAFAAEHAYSAAYAIFSAGGRGTVARTGGVGSIGVVTTHVDISGAMEKNGLAVSFIFAGDHKVDGNPYQPLPPEVKARIQERIDELYGIFTSTVARNRGLDEQAVRDTQALCFTASQATSNGLADDVGKLDDALAAFAASLDEPSDNEGDDEMAETAETNTSAVDQAAHEAAVAAAREEARVAGLAEGATSAQARISAILGSEEATGREELAKHLALETDTTAEAAKGILAKSPKAAPTGGATPFENAMSEHNPEVGASGGEAEGGETNPVDLARKVGLACVRPAATK